jgi:hypothetical protein
MDKFNDCQSPDGASRLLLKTQAKRAETGSDKQALPERRKTIIPILGLHRIAKGWLFFGATND